MASLASVFILLLVLASESLSLPQRGPCLGCHSESDLENPVTKQVIDFITNQIKNEMGHGNDDKCELLINDLSVTSQVVAGTRHRLNFQASNENCQPEIAQKWVCKNLDAFQPLPFACEEPLENPLCLDTPDDISDYCQIELVVNQDDIIKRQGCPGCPKTADFDDEEVRMAVDFVKDQVKNEYAFNLPCEFSVEGEPEVKTQVVAGTKYIINVRINNEKCSLDLGVPRLNYNCEEIEIFRPLPMDCISTNENPLCLQVIREVNEYCKPRQLVDLRTNNQGLIFPETSCAGCHHPEDLSSSRVKEVIEFLKSQVQSKIGAERNCKIRIQPTPKISSQVVAGTNYKVTIGFSSQFCNNNQVWDCKEIDIFEPLPHECEGTNNNNPRCLETYKNLEEYCDVKNSQAV